MWRTLKEETEYKAGANEGLEKVLLQCFQQKRSENVPISMPILCQKTTDIELFLKIDNFKVSGSIGI
jgi:hypothetical protein